MLKLNPRSNFKSYMPLSTRAVTEINMFCFNDMIKQHDDTHQFEKVTLLIE